MSQLSRSGLVETAAAKVVGDNDVCDGVKYELDVVSVGSTSSVAVYILGGALVLSLELRLDVRRRCVELLRPLEFRETYLQWTLFDFSRKKIPLVEEENY